MAMILNAHWEQHQKWLLAREPAQPRCHQRVLRRDPSAWASTGLEVLQLVLLVHSPSFPAGVIDLKADDDAVSRHCFRQKLALSCAGNLNTSVLIQGQELCRDKAQPEPQFPPTAALSPSAAPHQKTELMSSMLLAAR